MAIRKVVFSNAVPKAVDHGALFAGILNDGIVKGCAISYLSGSGFTIEKGYLIACGRLFEVSSSETTAHSSGAVARLFVRIDVSDPTNETVEFQTDTAASESALPVLVQDDINDISSNGVYECELAVVNTSTGEFIRKTDSCALKPIYIQTSVPTSSSKDGIYLITE